MAAGECYSIFVKTICFLGLTVHGAAFHIESRTTSKMASCLAMYSETPIGFGASTYQARTQRGNRLMAEVLTTLMSALLKIVQHALFNLTKSAIVKDTA